MPNTKVKSHRRKGTKGVKSHIRKTGVGSVPGYTKIEESLSDVEKRLPSDFKVIDKGMTEFENYAIIFKGDGGWQNVRDRINREFGMQARNINQIGNRTYRVILSPLRFIEN